MKYTHEQIDDTFNKAPEKLQKFIVSETVANSLEVLMNGFGIEEGGKRELVYIDILSLMVGLGTIEEFSADLVTNNIVSQEEVNEFVIDVYRLVLEPAHYIVQSPAETSNPVPIKIQTTPANSPITTPVTTPLPPLVTPATIPSTNTPKAQVPSTTPSQQGSNTLPKPKMDVPRYGTSPVTPKSIQPSPSSKALANFLLAQKAKAPAATQPTTPQATIPAYKAPIPQPTATPSTTNNLEAAEIQPQPAVTPTPSIIDAKLSGTTRMQTEEVDVSKQKKPGYTGVDPYREAA